MQRSASLLTTYLREQKLRVTALALLLFGGIGLQLAGPLLLRGFIDGAIAGDGLRRLQLLAGLFIAVSLVSQGAAVAAAYFSEQVGWTATNLLRVDLMRHCLRLDMPFHNGRSPGEMIERVDGDVTRLSTFVSQFVIVILGGMLLLAGVLVLLWIEEPLVGAALTLFTLLALVVLSRTARLAVPRVTEEREQWARHYGFIEERLGGVDDIRANGGGGYVMRRLGEGIGRLRRAERRSQVMSATVWTTATAMFTASYILVLALGAYLYQAGDVTIGTVYLFFQYTQILRRPLEQIADQLKEFQQAGAAMARVHELRTIQPRVVGGSGGSLPGGALSVSFDAVSFAYRADEPVLGSISFEQPAGSLLGVLGRTGCGKSTLARLLVRLYDPTEGAIQLGGVDLRAIELDELRRRVGIVTQDVQLFQASLRDNLTLFDREIADDRLLRALDELGLSDWLRAQPQGLDSVLGSGGQGLSAGEAQLLAFTRVFLRDPGLVILDEASSRLDPATERLIDAAIARLVEGRTAIVIAHRLGTVERVDDVIILERGGIAERGPRAELAADAGSRYAGLLRTAAVEVPA